MRRPANLAQRPFRNERLPAALLGTALVALLLVTAEHARIARKLLPDATSARHAEAAALEEEVARLRTDGVALRLPGPDKTAVTRWVVLKEMVDRRSFAWTALMARLEATVPPGVRLTTVSPSWDQGRLRLGLKAVTHSSDEGFELVKALEDQPDFDEVYPISRGAGSEDEGEYAFDLTMLYLPSHAPAPDAGAFVAPSDAAGEAEEDQG